MNDETPNPRVRIVACVVHLQAVTDDGTWLEPVDVPAAMVPARNWPPTLEQLEAHVYEQLQREQPN